MNGLALFLHLAALGTVATAAFLPHRKIGYGRLRFYALLGLVFASAAVTLGRPWEIIASESFIAKLVAGVAILFTLGVLVLFLVARTARQEIRIDALLFPVPLGISFVALTAFAATPYGVGKALFLLGYLLAKSGSFGTGLVACTSAWRSGDFPKKTLVRFAWCFMLFVLLMSSLAWFCSSAEIGGCGTLEEKLALLAALLLALAGLFFAKRGSNKVAAVLLSAGLFSLVAGEVMGIGLD